MRIAIFFGPPKFPVKFSRGELWLQFTVYSPPSAVVAVTRETPPSALWLRFPAKGTPSAL